MQATSRSGPLTVFALALATALLALALAWPRLAASLRYLPVDHAIERYYDDREIPSDRLLTLMDFAHQAIARHDHYRYRDGLSLLAFLRGLDPYAPALERRDRYREAERQAMHALAQAPAKPELWLRVATVRSLLRDEPATVLEPWRMSVFTGRTHSTLLAPRAGLGLTYLGAMDSESRAMLRDQLVLAWTLQARELRGELRQRDPELAAARALLADFAPSVLNEMEAALERAP